jgi:serine protease Do
MQRFASMTILALTLSSLSCSGKPGDEPSAGVRLDERERLVSEAIARARESAVALEYSAAGAPAGARRVATGVVINDEGDVLSVRIDRPPTNAPIVARDAAGRRLRVHWVAADRETGLTLLRIEGSHPRPSRAATRPARLGSEVLIIGNPFGLGHSVSRGGISGLDRRLELGNSPLGGLIQVDAPLHPGDSGAMVADLRGEWLGLVRSGLATPDAERTHDHDLGFAIPAPDALWVAGQLRAHGRVDRAYLGVRLDPGRPNDPPGAVLDDVLDDTPAARAGLRSGDRVVTLDGYPVHTPRELTDRLDRTPADGTATVEFIRASKRDRLTLHTAYRPRREHTSAPTEVSKTDETPQTLPREVLERIEHLERQIEKLETEKGKRTAQRP